MTTKHTPGPWIDKAFDKSQWNVYDSHGWPVAQALQIKVLNADIKQAERTANARLIAAAPDLIEALTVLSDWVESLISDNECRPLENARAAIAKATGETQ
jgi:hypothetical protein